MQMLSAVFKRWMSICYWCAASGAALAVFFFSVRGLESLPSIPSIEAMRVHLPVPLQLGATAGDAHLAANVNVIRAILVGTGELDAETYRVLGQIQLDASAFNACHEDNYYLAAGILPWSGEVAVAQDVLKAATECRVADPLPPFFLGFLYHQFQRDYMSAARYAEVAASRSDGPNQLALRAIAAKWYERVPDPSVAVGILKQMALASRDPALKGFLLQRARRVAILIELQEAAKDYAQINRHLPTRLRQLVGYGKLQALPEDPLGIGYTIDAEGVPQLALKRMPQ